MGVTELVFELSPHEGKIRGTLNGLYCWYGSLLYGENNQYLFANYKHLFDTIIIVQLLKRDSIDPSNIIVGKSRKPVPATLRYFKYRGAT